MKLTDLHAIFFDFDGVILDSTKIKSETFRKMYQPYGDEIVEKVLAHHRYHGGISRVEKIKFYHQTFLNIPLSTQALDTLSMEFSASVKDQVIEAPWIPGAEAFLLATYHLLPLYIVSGTPQEELTEIVHKRKLEPFFKEILGSPVRKPVHVRRIIEEQKFEPHLCLFVGDAMTDLNTALETNTRFIGVQGDVSFPSGTTVLADCTNLMDRIEAMD